MVYYTGISNSASVYTTLFLGSETLLLKFTKFLETLLETVFSLSFSVLSLLLTSSLLVYRSLSEHCVFSEIWRMPDSRPMGKVLLTSIVVQKMPAVLCPYIWAFSCHCSIPEVTAFWHTFPCLKYFLLDCICS